MRTLMTGDSFTASLLRHVRSEMEALVDAEAEAAAERVRIKAREMAPRLAMALMSNFDIAHDQQEIVIRVRTEEVAA